MFIYSKKIAQFIQDIKSIIKVVLSQEVCLKVSGNWFMDRSRKHYYPISVRIYNDRNMLGYFDPNVHELGFHERLMYVSKQQLKDIIRHEIAHYLLFIDSGDQTSAHGVEFRIFCQNLGWGEEVYSATLQLEDVQKVEEKEPSDVLRKVKKLMALSNSSNQHESELAMIKSQQLLLKYNIDSTYVGIDDEEKVYLKRILRQPQRTEKMCTIATILNTFLVSAVFSRKEDGTYLEILGSKINVEIAEYVAAVLQDKLDVLWEQTKREHAFKGVVAKNSFFRGIASGYISKINALKNSYSSEVAASLILIQGKLKEAQEMAYGRLTSTTRSSQFCPESSELGKQAGRALKISPGIGESAMYPKLLQ